MREENPVRFSRREAIAGGLSALTLTAGFGFRSPDWTSALPHWISGVALPAPQSEFGVATIGNRIYAAGGFGANGRADFFDPKLNEWVRIPDVPTPIHHAGVAALSGRLYVVGGYRIDDLTAVSSVLVYDPAAVKWSQVAPLAPGRGAFGIAVSGGIIYAIGGALAHLSGPATNRVDRYDPATDSWTSAAPIPIGREHLTAAAIGTNIYVACGRANGNESDEYATAFDCYDVLTDTWRAGPPVPTGRAGAGSAVLNSRMVVIGGERGQRVYSTVEAFNVQSGTWAELPSLPVARHGIGVGYLGNEIFACGGSTVADVAQNSARVDILLNEER